MNNKYKIVFKDGTEKVFNSKRALNVFLLHKEEDYIESVNNITLIE